jgi:hypothetical protein
MFFRDGLRHVPPRNHPIMKTTSSFLRLVGPGLTLMVACAFLPLNVQASSALPVRNRIQWLENNGYCGETSLQEIALYFGTYASQARIRAIYDPSQQNDLVELEEWAQVLPALGLKADVFPTEALPAPQFHAYAAWMKRHLEARHPVIVTGYVFEQRDTENPVDHIMTASGYVGCAVAGYSDDDTFIINDHYRSTAAFALQARWLFDTRDMQANGATYGLSIQKEYNYGLAITGTTNRSPFALPVRLELDRIDEPNLISGESPADFAATVTVEGLLPGKVYVLYRYNDPTKVPVANYTAAPHDGAVSFRARQPVQSFPASIRSDRVVTFRCLPAGK